MEIPPAGQNRIPAQEFAQQLVEQRQATQNERGHQGYAISFGEAVETKAEQ